MTDILIGRNDSASVSLDPHYGNRHGMIAGATGTGKSVSLMVLARRANDKAADADPARRARRHLRRQALSVR